MTEVEILRFKNIALQRQILERDNRRINTDEIMLVNEISARLNIENPKEWLFDIDNGTITKRPSEQK